MSPPKKTSEDRVTTREGSEIRPGSQPVVPAKKIIDHMFYDRRIGYQVLQSTSIHFREARLLWPFKIEGFLQSSDFLESQRVSKEKIPAMTIQLSVSNPSEDPEGSWRDYLKVNGTWAIQRRVCVYLERMLKHFEAHDLAESLTNGNDPATYAVVQDWMRENEYRVGPYLQYARDRYRPYEGG
jgi:hypothetical protein